MQNAKKSFKKDDFQRWPLFMLNMLKISGFNHF